MSYFTPGVPLAVSWRMPAVCEMPGAAGAAAPGGRALMANRAGVFTAGCQAAPAVPEDAVQQPAAHPAAAGASAEDEVP